MRDWRWIAWIPLTLIFSAHAPALFAQAWDFSAHANLSHTYTDNVSLASGDGDGGDHITSARAGFALSRERPTNSLDLSYNILAVDYWDSNNRDDVYHQFAADLMQNLVRERLFLDAGASYTQRIVSNRDAVPIDLLTFSRNRADVASFYISPYLRESFGRLASAEIRYTYEKDDYVRSEFNAFDSETNRFHASLISGPAFRTISWEVNYRRDEISYGDDSEVVFDMLEGLLRWHIGQSLSIFGAGGRERNDFAFNPFDRPRPDDEFWRAGFTWTPSLRSTLTMYYGERFFGETYGLTFEHRSRSARLFASYVEQPTTVSDVEMLPVLVLVQNEAGELFLIEFEIPDLVTDVYISRRFTAGASGARKRLQWELRMYHDRREYQSGAASDQRVHGAAANVTLRITGRANATFGTLWQRTLFVDDDREDDLWVLSAGMSRDLGRRASASLTYRYQQRDSNALGSSYEENRITATLSARF